jgi:hypothetical protein
MAWFFKYFSQDVEYTSVDQVVTGLIGGYPVREQAVTTQNIGDPADKQLCRLAQSQRGHHPGFRMLQGFSLIYRAERELP